MDKKLKELGECDKDKRTKLAGLIKDVKKIFPREEDIAKLHMIEGLLSQDGTSDNIRLDCDRRIDMLQEKECYVLVSGNCKILLCVFWHGTIV